MQDLLELVQALYLVKVHTIESFTGLAYKLKPQLRISITTAQ